MKKLLALLAVTGVLSIVGCTQPKAINTPLATHTKAGPAAAGVRNPNEAADTKRPAEKPAEKPADKPAEKPAEKAPATGAGDKTPPAPPK